jgi:hypothetical protein
VSSLAVWLAALLMVLLAISSRLPHDARIQYAARIEALPDGYRQPRVDDDGLPASV